jgi:hypothetical protein
MRVAQVGMLFARLMDGPNETGNHPAFFLRK